MDEEGSHNTVKKYFCPTCDHILSKRFEGYVCKNWKCVLYHKLERGWVLHVRDDDKSINFQIINNLWKRSGAEISLKWAKVKAKILKRDDYTCKLCGWNLANRLTNGLLIVHHIVPAHKEMALYLDKDNCITVCQTCHDKLHSNDKYKFKQNG